MDISLHNYNETEEYKEKQHKLRKAENSLSC